jgi:hypothetical protein
VTFDEMKQLEPELGRLERHIEQIGRKRGKPFCANGLWYFYFKPAMCQLVGYEARRKELQSSEAYDVALHHLYYLLPDCRHDGMICNG